ncbi:hypothetical protein ACU4GH_09475 [Bradyrhizobium betae]
MDVAVLPTRRKQLGRWRPHHQGGALMRAALKIVMAAIFAVPAAAALAKSPDCASWPTNMALVHLKNAGLIDIPSVIEAQTRAVRLASEKIGKDLYQQVYDITFRTSDGKTIEVITNSRASSEECSMSGVDVYVVSNRIGGAVQPRSEGATKSDPAAPKARELELTCSAAPVGR